MVESFVNQGGGPAGTLSLDTLSFSAFLFNLLPKHDFYQIFHLWLFRKVLERKESKC